MTSTVQTSATRPATTRFFVLDGIRGIGAMFVMFYHYTDSADFTFLRGSWFAVDMFFFLSGFVIYHAYANKVLGGMPAGVFVNRRLARLAPTVTAGVLFGAAAALLYYFTTGTPFDALKFTTVHLGNIAFIPALLDYNIPPTGLGALFPTNSPLWSIFFEMAASLGFVIFVRWPRWLLSLATVLTFTLFITACVMLSNSTGRPLTGDLGWSYNTFFYGFPRAIGPFMCGMVIYTLTQGDNAALNRFLPIWKSRMSALFVYAFLFAILLFPFRFGGAYPFFALVVLTPFLIVFGARSMPEDRRLIALSDWLGQVSFPLYCIHVPVRRLIEYSLDAAGVTGLAWRYELLISFAAAIIISHLLLVLFDRMKAGRRVSALLKPITG